MSVRLASGGEGFWTGWMDFWMKYGPRALEGDPIAAMIVSGHNMRRLAQLERSAVASP